uniref:Ig-like domain-containing protein n=1 Tax=Pelusios castaneus TaxID=367368 RepID=A0A8C8SQZ8_9SAUR
GGPHTLILGRASPPVSPESLALRVLQTIVFHNASSTDTEVKALLGDLETLALNCSTCEIRFLQPWAPQLLAAKEWQDLELEIHRSLADFVLTANRIVQQMGADYPFVTQASIGCELHPNQTSRGFYDIGVNGEGFIHFDEAAGAWLAGTANQLVLRVSSLVNWDKNANTRLQYFLRITCIYVIHSFAQSGRESLERQERPVAVVFARAPPAAGTPSSTLVVCRVTGFYPRPIRVSWLQDGEEVAPGWRLNSTGILPNADLTYQLRSSLAVEPGDGHSYACRVEHVSLGGHSLLIPWRHSRRWRRGLVVGITLGVLVVAAVAVAVALWWSRRRGVPAPSGPGGGGGAIHPVTVPSVLSSQGRPGLWTWGVQGFRGQQPQRGYRPLPWEHGP